MGLFGEKKLGFGLMRLPLTDPNDMGAIDKELTCKMVDAFLAQGFTYFDTAWMYCGFNSENAVKDCLTSRYPRDRFTLTTKLHGGFVNSLEDRDKIFNEQLRKTGAGYFDYYLLHDMGSDQYQTYQKYDCFTWIQEKKRQGLVKHIGFSCHDNADFLEKALTEHPEFEFVQLQVNYLDWESPAIQSRKCCEVAKKHGKPVIVMEPVKGGTLARVPAQVEQAYKAYHPELSVPSWAIRFAASQEPVELVLSGMSNLEQMQDNLSYMAQFQPLNAQEVQLVEKAVETINSSIAIPCTGCSYCTDGCPQQIAIPRYFSLYNADLQEVEEKGWTPQGEYYDRLILHNGKASDCLECGACESICPQHLPIIDNLKKVAEHFGK